jgi:repressor LexA
MDGSAKWTGRRRTSGSRTRPPSPLAGNHLRGCRASLSCPLIRYGAGESVNPWLSVDAGATEAADPLPRDAKSFTSKQGLYFAFIYYYTKIHGRPPAEADFQRFFRVTSPVVHQMIKTLAARGFIDREPGPARSIRLRLTRAQLPDLE